MTMDTRLIEVAFPLRQASLDSVREKYGPRGHISGFHLWPARRPLAASRAALIATLLPDPGTPEARRKLVERIGGRISQRKSKDGVKEETEGGILRWGRETSPDVEWFREEIRKAHGGRAPRVLDPFAGGGAIPFEAMRLACEVTAADINPVAWFILKCTLEYPQRLAGQTRPLPDFVRRDRDFLEAFFKAHGLKGAALQAQVDRVTGKATAPSNGKATTGRRTRKTAVARQTGNGAHRPDNVQAMQLPSMEAEPALPEADLAWHVRAWGKWVLDRARADLAPYYPTVDGKPTVAYLWARTVTCRHCRATIPLLKTRWLCKKEKKRIVLTMEPNAERMGVVFGIQNAVSQGKGSAAQKKVHDKRIGGGTMSKSGATCPCCHTINSTEDIRLEGKAGRLGAIMTAVVVDGKDGKEYRLPRPVELGTTETAKGALDDAFVDVPFGLPQEPVPQGGSRASGGSPFTTYIYGLTHWCDLFTPRQLLALGTFVKHTRAACDPMTQAGYPIEWVEALDAYLATSLDRLIDHCTTVATWYVPGENVKHTFVRYALQITWDFAESNPLFSGGGSWASALAFSTGALEHALRACNTAPQPAVVRTSAIALKDIGKFDIVMTDPPYYDAIPYSDLMNIFYVWLKRTLRGLSSDMNATFAETLAPKWDVECGDGELIDDPSRFGGDKAISKATYEEGMARAFQVCQAALAPDGRLVIVFAHKQPDAWETLVAAIIRAGFVVDGSWPIQTENATRSRARASAALSSSVWLVCKKRPATARPGWDTSVRDEMRANITTKLRDFWDAGIRGPDFVWAATGPALEAYSKYPVVKKANQPGEITTVSEFLAHARRIVVEFVVGRVLGQDSGGEEEARELDPITTYYLLHRNDFKLEPAPVGPCILYAVSCGLRDSDLTGRYDLLARGGGTRAAADEDEETEDAEETDVDAAQEAAESGGGSTVKLKP